MSTLYTVALPILVIIVCTYMLHKAELTYKVKGFTLEYLITTLINYLVVLSCVIFIIVYE